MISHKKSIAITTASPALGSIFAMMLEQTEGLRVQQFAGIEALVSHMRLLPVDLIVSDYDLETGSLPDLVAKLRKTLPSRRYQLVVLADHISREVKLSCKFAGVDEVLVKPMSPLFLKERIMARLGIEIDEAGIGAHRRTPRARHSRPSKGAAVYSGNVIPLFGAPDNPDRQNGDSLHPA